ncbi:Met-10 like family protein [Trifolium repens]|nr:Met-10 like family protein [Trifolium repens]
MMHALKLALSNGFERVIFESDCQQVVNALHNDCLYANELGTLLSTCSSLLIPYANYNIAYVTRQANRVAHNLARASLFQSSPNVQHFYPPNSAIAALIERASTMISNLFLNPQLYLLPFPSKFLFHSHTLNKPSLLHSLPIITNIFSTAATFSYGPTLHKITNPSQSPHHQNDNDDDILNEQIFTRVFHLAALRVPSRECFSLENRLRGHLLNWPRIRNIARVPGDAIDPNIAPLLGQQINGKDDNGKSEENKLIEYAGISDKILSSPVLYRDRLAQTFNTRGYVNFRNLAKISRPKRNKKKNEKEGKLVEVEGNKRIGKNSYVTVEVVEEEEDGVYEGLRNLIGEEFVNGKWRGSTRLLLLDERYKDYGVDELPEAIKAVLKEYKEKSTTLTFELVRCKLTLFYDYWQTNEILEALLPEGMIVPTTFETVGHIAHLNLREEHLPYKKLIAKVVLDKNKPKIQTVANKTDSIHNEYRTMQLEVLAGNHSLVTTLAENGLRFHVDLAKVYALFP